MRRSQCVFLAAVAVIGFASIASAADMPVKAPAYKAPIAAPVYDWTGFYIGGNVGGVNERALGTSNFTDTSGFGGPSVASNPQSNSFSNTRFIGGLQVGYNWQFDPHWVLGVEADWDWTRTGYDFCRQNVLVSSDCGANLSGVETVSSQTKGLATARARLGVTLDKFLFYGTGGAAWGSVDTTLGLNCLAGGCGGSNLRLSAASTTNTIKAGWVAGLGVEAMLTGNWTARAEWLHIDLSTISASLATTGTPGVQTASWSRTERFDEFRVGLNYRFAGIGWMH